VPDAAYFHARAARCRGLLALAADREIIDQLRLWIADFNADAGRAGRRAAPAHEPRPGRAAQMSGLIANASGQSPAAPAAPNTANDRRDRATALASDPRTAEAGRSYRVLAAQCREMASRAAKPAPLVARAIAFEAYAGALDLL
jgi:hypothetical protein